MIFFLKQKLAFKFLMHVFLLMISWQKLVGLPLSKMNMMKKKNNFKSQTFIIFNKFLNHSLSTNIRKIVISIFLFYLKELGSKRAQSPSLCLSVMKTQCPP